MNAAKTYQLDKAMRDRANDLRQITEDLDNKKNEALDSIKY